MYPNFAPSPPVESRTIAKPSRVVRTERVLPSFDLESINTKKWYRKEADLWAELGDEIPFG
jgi:hypothetical protein